MPQNPYGPDYTREDVEEGMHVCSKCGERRVTWEISVPAYSSAVRAMLYCLNCDTEFADWGKTDLLRVLNTITASSALNVNTEAVPCVTVHSVITHARDLVSDYGENPEYDRALVELVRDVTGNQDDGGREFVETLIGVKR